MIAVTSSQDSFSLFVVSPSLSGNLIHQLVEGSVSSYYLFTFYLLTLTCLLICAIDFLYGDDDNDTLTIAVLASKYLFSFISTCFTHTALHLREGEHNSIFIYEFSVSSTVVTRKSSIINPDGATDIIPIPHFRDHFFVVLVCFRSTILMLIDVPVFCTDVIYEHNRDSRNVGLTGIHFILSML